MPDTNSKYDLRGLSLAIPAIAFLLLYMTAQEFTFLDQAIALVFIALLAYGTLLLQQRQKREQLQRMEVRDRERRTRDK